jgi:hypothetical protein
MLLLRQKRIWQPKLSEIHEYTLDLQRVTLLRDKSEGQERLNYDTCIDVMQKVLVFLNTPPKTKI